MFVLIFIFLIFFHPSQPFYIPILPSKSSSTVLNNQFAALTESITSSFSTLPQSTAKLTPSNTKRALEKVREALVNSDVNVGVADKLLDGVRDQFLGKKVVGDVTGEQYFIKLFYDELVDMMGGDSSSEEKGNDALEGGSISYNPSGLTTVVMAGLQGAGKTTFVAKLGRYLQEDEIDVDAVRGMTQEEREGTLRTRLPRRKRKIMVAPGDVHRPAAEEQLRVMCKRAGVEVYTPKEDEVGNAVAIARGCVSAAKEGGFDTVLIDTAGRQTVNERLMKELRDVNKEVKPDEVLLVVDAMTGQEAAETTKAFDDAVGLTGAVLTKTDGDSKGGAAVSIKAVSGKDIKFVGTGEGVKDIDAFFPKRMASRILGMGDVISLVEKASQEVTDAEAQKMAEKMKDATFDFDDFMKQSRLVSKMGNFAGVAKMIPGMAGKIDDKMLRTAEDRLKKSEAMITSMTKKEKSNPDLLITDRTARSRLERIAKGSGNEFQDAMGFVGEFQKMKTMMSRMQKQMNGEAMEDGGEDAAKAIMAGGQGAMGNRQQRRMAKKNKKTGRGGGGGFG